MSASPQFEVLRPFITERVQALVRERLLDGKLFFKNHSLLPGYSRPEVKMALLLVRIANPSEQLNKDEEALLR
jgi:hypothetical protein